jgi:hypothetical protein
MKFRISIFIISFMYSLLCVAQEHPLCYLYIFVEKGKTLSDLSRELGGYKSLEIINDNNIKIDYLAIEYIFPQDTNIKIRVYDQEICNYLYSAESATDALFGDKLYAFIEQLYLDARMEFPSVLKENKNNPGRILAMLGMGTLVTAGLKKGGAVGKVIKHISILSMGYFGGKIGAVVREINELDSEEDAREFSSNLSDNGQATAQLILDTIAAGIGSMGSAAVYSKPKIKTPQKEITSLTVNTTKNITSNEMNEFSRSSLNVLQILCKDSLSIPHRAWEKVKIILLNANKIAQRGHYSPGGYGDTVIFQNITVAENGSISLQVKMTYGDFILKGKGGGYTYPSNPYNEFEAKLMKTWEKNAADIFGTKDAELITKMSIVDGGTSHNNTQNYDIAINFLIN